MTPFSLLLTVTPPALPAGPLLVLFGFGLCLLGAVYFGLALRRGKQ